MLNFFLLLWVSGHPLLHFDKVQNKQIQWNMLTHDTPNIVVSIYVAQVKRQLGISGRDWATQLGRQPPHREAQQWSTRSRIRWSKKNNLNGMSKDWAMEYLFPTFLVFQIEIYFPLFRGSILCNLSSFLLMFLDLFLLNLFWWVQKSL